MAQGTQKTSYQAGIWAETLAALFLLLKGYRLCHRRYKTRYGEIDLIARKADSFIFVEVKRRKSDEDALEAVTLKNRERVSRAAQYFMSRQKDPQGAMRFDVIAVTPPFSVSHLPNAW